MISLNVFSHLAHKQAFSLFVRRMFTEHTQTGGCRMEPNVQSHPTL